MWFLELTPCDPLPPPWWSFGLHGVAYVYLRIYLIGPIKPKKWLIINIEVCRTSNTGADVWQQKRLVKNHWSRILSIRLCLGTFSTCIKNNLKQMNIYCSCRQIWACPNSAFILNVNIRKYEELRSRNFLLRKIWENRLICKMFQPQIFFIR